MSILYMNAQSVLNKVNELASVIATHNPDIVILTETWCNNTITNAFLSIPGYNLENDLRLDRTDTANGIGGGILVYVKNGFTVLPINDRTNSFNQYCMFKIKCTNNLELNILAAYRSPNSSEENTNKLCDLICNMKDNCIVIGDINLPGINWDVGTSDKKGAAFLTSAETRFLEQMVRFPTHIKGNILDIVLTDKPNNIIDIQDIGRLGKSDHSMLLIQTQIKPCISKTQQQIPDLNKADFPSMKTQLDIDWQMELDGKGAEDAWDFFLDKINKAMEDNIPKKLRRNVNKPLWMSKSINKSVRQKQRLWNNYKQTKEYTAFLAYKKIEKQLHKQIRKAKKKLERKLAMSKNKRSFSSYVKSRTKTQSTVGPLIGQDGKLTNDDEEMAVILNKFFSSVFSDEGNTPVPSLNNLPTVTSLDNLAFTESKVKIKIDKLNPSSSPGPDGITARVLKEMRDIIALPLSLIFTKSLQEGAVSQIWKQANINPIFKKGVKGKPGNYRPVSLTSIVCKLMESILRDGITEHLTSNNLINNSQHGFMKNRSCLTNLLEFLEKVTDAVDQGFNMDIIYLDFAKAFDKVPRLRLLEKLRAHSIGGNIYRWCSEWLLGRTQRVVLNGKSSGWCPVLSGVPQGSVLGPVMFVIFINDIDGAVEDITIIKKFADDTKIGQIIKVEQDDCLKLQTALDNLSNWAKTWGMAFNHEKCHVMHVGRLNPSHNYTMDGHELDKISWEKDIGVIIHDSLKPSQQCAESARKARGVLSQIKHAFHFRDRVVLVNLYKIYVRPHLEFSVPAWAPWSEGDSEVLEKVQKQLVSMISGLAGKTYEEKLVELKLQSLAERRVRYDMVETFKIMHGYTNVNRDVWFSTVEGSSQRVTRLAADPLNLRAKPAKLDIRKYFFSNRVVEHWNQLPQTIKNAKSVMHFKAMYDKQMGL